jgi:hypothetical protein
LALIAAASLIGAFLGVVAPGISSADNSSGCDFAATGTTQSCSGPLAGSTFAGGDGNLLTNPTTFGTTDWQNVPGLHAGFDLPSGTGDNSFGQGTKEDNPAVTTVSGSIPPNKSDLTRFYEASEVGTNNHNFLYLAWERSNVLGSANMDFEINQAATPGLGSPGAHTINRTAGDLLVTFDFTNGGGKPTLGLLFWLTAAAGNNAGQCFSSKTLPCWGNQETLNGSDSIGAVNNLDPVTDPLFPASPNYINPVPALQFGETAIDLTGAGVFPPGTCEAFGSTFIKSRSSASFTAEIKDFIAPVPVNINNCGEVKIIKQTDPRGQSQVFNFTSASQKLPQSSTAGGVACPGNSAAGVQADGSFCLNDTGNTGKTLGSTDPAQNSTGNTVDEANLQQGTYTVSEGTVPGGFTFESLNCTADAASGSTVTTSAKTATINLKPSGVVTCVYVNQLNTATLATQVSNAGPVFPSTAVHDTATVTGNQTADTPSGTVTFFLCSQVPAGGSCNTGGTNIGTGTLSGSGATASATSPDVNSAASPLTPGTYCFRAEWPGDTNYPGALKEFGAATECFTVKVIGTTTVTTPSVGKNGTATFGSSVTDTAVVTAAQTGDGFPSGTVTFSICDPTQTCSQVGQPVPTTDLGTTPIPSSQAVSGAVVVNKTGTWCFQATYVPGPPNGANYTGSSDTSSTECFTVTDTTGATSAQNWLPNDTTTVTATNGAPLSGTLSAQLVNGTCAAPGTAVPNQLYQKTLTNATSAADRTLTTNNGDPANPNPPFVVTTPGGSFSWLVTFTSTDTNVQGSTHCESTNLTINDNG